MNDQEVYEASQLKISFESLINIENENKLIRNDICLVKQFISKQQLSNDLFQQQLVDMNLKLDKVILNQELLLQKLNVKSVNETKTQVKVSGSDVNDTGNNPDEMVWQIDNFEKVKEDFSTKKICWLDSPFFYTNSRRYPVKLRLFFNNSIAMVSILAEIKLEETKAFLTLPVTITLTLSVINQRNGSTVISETKDIKYQLVSYVKFNFSYSLINQSNPRSDVFILKCLAKDSVSSGA